MCSQISKMMTTGASTLFSTKIGDIRIDPTPILFLTCQLWPVNCIGHFQNPQVGLQPLDCGISILFYSPTLMDPESSCSYLTAVAQTLKTIYVSFTPTLIGFRASWRTLMRQISACHASSFFSYKWKCIAKQRVSYTAANSSPEAGQKKIMPSCYDYIFLTFHNSSHSSSPKMIQLNGK